jgi:hypothetical protein
MATGEFPFSSVSNIINTNYDISKIQSEQLRDVLLHIFTKSSVERISISDVSVCLPLCFVFVFVLFCFVLVH